MNKSSIKTFIFNAFTGFSSLALAIILYFIILRFSSIQSAFNSLNNILKPFIYGGVMAYLLKSPCNYLERFFKKRLPKKYGKLIPGLCVVIVLFISFFSLYILFSMVLPEIIHSIESLTRIMPSKINAFTKWIENTAKENSLITNYATPLIQTVGNRVRSWSQTDLLPTLEGMINGFSKTVSSFLTIIKNVSIGIIVCVYILLNRKTLARQGKAIIYSILPERYAILMIDELCFIDKTFNGFLSGKIIDSTIVGLICYVFCFIMSLTMGFTNIMLISVIVGVTNMIPYFGPYIGMVPSALLLLITSPINSIVFLVFVFILQQIDGNILGPRLLANSVGLSGIWVLFSITLFGGIFGFIGILVGVPVFAVIYDLIRRVVVHSLRQKGKLHILYENRQE